MKFKLDIYIEKPIDKVMQRMEQQEHRLLWLKGLQSIQAISGKHGEQGARSRMIFTRGKRTFALIENIILKDLPTHYEAHYESDGFYGISISRFDAVSESRTRYTMEQHISFFGFMKLKALLMPGAIKNTARTYMMDFKEFVESCTD